MPVGGSDRQMRQFLRSINVKPNVANMERWSKHTNISQGEHEARERIAREKVAEGKATPTRDARGDVKARVKAAVKRSIANRKGGDPGVKKRAE